MDRWARSSAWAFGSLSLCLAAAATYACLPDLPGAGMCGDGQIDPGEQCDPGRDQTNAGCDQYCQLLCSGYHDPASNHCYLALPSALTYDDAVTACRDSFQGHVVTFVDDDELDDLKSNLSGGWKSDTLLWAGLAAGAGGDYFSAAQGEDEPGWVAAACGGCFLHGGKLLADAGIDGGPDAGAPYAIADKDPLGGDNGAMVVLGANMKGQVICEREPVGARSVPCNGDGSFCFGLLTTQSPTPAQSKRYLYNPTPMTATAAASYCGQLSAGGAPSLVILNSQAEREQLIYELTQLPLLMNGPAPPVQFWIGLVGSHQPLDDSTVWRWANGATAGKTPTTTPPEIWGGNSLSPDYPGSYAYIVLDDGQRYDTGLASASRADSNGPTYPFVCQYLY